MADLSPKFTEHAVLLGKRQSLVGILTRSVAPPQPGEPAVVILNTGVVHRVGHHRMYVDMSRLFASAGRTVLRFDFSGIGDSDQRVDQLSPLNSCLGDIKEVLDSLERNQQASRFVLVGLCSGADHAILYSHGDPRVVGLVLMDPTIPPTARYYLYYIAQRLVHFKNWISVATLRSGLMRKLLAQALHGVRSPQRPERLTLESLQYSPYLAHCYRSAVARGVKILAVFTAISPRSTYRKHMLDAFPDASFGSALKLEFFSDSDHLFTAGRDRSRLSRVIMDWLGAASHP